ncbi:hypothetical protein PFISCL1PPCAC_14214, partial [Pristionchus fissidentatus]
SFAPLHWYRMVHSVFWSPTLKSASTLDAVTSHFLYQFFILDVVRINLFRSLFVIHFREPLGYRVHSHVNFNLQPDNSFMMDEPFVSVQVVPCDRIRSSTDCL